MQSWIATKMAESSPAILNEYRKNFEDSKPLMEIGVIFNVRI
jgi:hypothetical protein